MCLFEHDEDGPAQIAGESALPQVGKEPLGGVGHDDLLGAGEVDHGELHRLDNRVEVNGLVAPDGIAGELGDVGQGVARGAHLVFLAERRLAAAPAGGGGGLG